MMIMKSFLTIALLTTVSPERTLNIYNFKNPNHSAGKQTEANELASEVIVNHRASTRSKFKTKLCTNYKCGLDFIKSLPKRNMNIASYGFKTEYGIVAVW